MRSGERRITHDVFKLKSWFSAVRENLNDSYSSASLTYRLLQTKLGFILRVSKLVNDGSYIDMLSQIDSNHSTCNCCSEVSELQILRIFNVQIFVFTSRPTTA